MDFAEVNRLILCSLCMYYVFFQNGNTMSEDLFKLETDVVDGEVCVERVANLAKLVERKTVNKRKGKIPHVDPTLEICAFAMERTGTCGVRYFSFFF